MTALEELNALRKAQGLKQIRDVPDEGDTHTCKLTATTRNGVVLEVTTVYAMDERSVRQEADKVFRAMRSKYRSDAYYFHEYGFVKGYV